MSEIYSDIFVERKGASFPAIKLPLEQFSKAELGTLLMVLELACDGAQEKRHELRMFELRRDCKRLRKRIERLEAR
jgi:hypothetical protein